MVVHYKSAHYYCHVNYCTVEGLLFSPVGWDVLGWFMSVLTPVLSVNVSRGLNQHCPFWPNMVFLWYVGQLFPCFRTRHVHVWGFDWIWQTLMCSCWQTQVQPKALYLWRIIMDAFVSLRPLAENSLLTLFCAKIFKYSSHLQEQNLINATEICETSFSTLLCSFSFHFKMINLPALRRSY